MFRVSEKILKSGKWLLRHTKLMRSYCQLQNNKIFERVIRISQEVANVLDGFLFIKR